MREKEGVRRQSTLNRVRRKNESPMSMPPPPPSQFIVPDVQEVDTGTMNSGLGYRHNDVTSSTITTTITSTVQSLLQECLVYHQQQEIIRSNSQQLHWNNDQQQQITERIYQNQSRIPNFVSSVVVGSSDDINTLTMDDTARTNDSNRAVPPPTNTWQTSRIELQKHQQQQHINQARERAQAILARFHPLESKDALTVQSLPSSTVDHDMDYAEQRRVGLQREAERKRQALIKNFAYLVERQSHRIQQLTEHVQVATARHDAARGQYNSILQQRKLEIECDDSQQQPPPAPPIVQLNGVHQRNAVVSSRDSTPATTITTTITTIAIYVSTTPIAMAWDESYVRQLFDTYGTIRNVILYRNKQSGLLKGDGLIIYTIDPWKETVMVGNNSTYTVQRDLIDLVCGQMNGAELPCGSILHVEPATSNYDDTQQPQPPRQSHSSTNVHHRHDSSNVEDAPLVHVPDANPLKPTDTNSDDLDEFFDSL